MNSTADIPALLDARIKERLGELAFVDGVTWTRMSSLTKRVRATIASETHVLTVDNPRFIHGAGVKALV